MQERSPVGVPGQVLLARPLEERLEVGVVGRGDGRCGGPGAAVEEAPQKKERTERTVRSLPNVPIGKTLSSS